MICNRNTLHTNTLWEILALTARAGVLFLALPVVAPVLSTAVLVAALAK